MTSRELVLAALEGQPTPRVPTGPLAVHYCAGLAGFSLRQYTTDAGALADSVIRYYERARPDAVWLSADTWVSAEAMGATVGAIGNDQPFGATGKPLIRSAADIDRIPPPDVGIQGRYPLMLEALDRIVKALGREVFVVACFDQYPFSLAAALMGINEIMVKVHDDPPLVEAVMARCAEYALAYACALSDAGADLLSGGDSPAGLIGPRLYGGIVLAAESALISKIRAATGKPVSLHICGNTQHILAQMATSGAAVLELDQATDMGEACRIVGPDIGLWGNLDPVRVLLQGSPEAVGAAASRVLAQISSAGHRRFVLSSGCTLAVGTPLANLATLNRVAQASATEA
jgi:MtaA/CmuA family methyltransferase